MATERNEEMWAKIDDSFCDHPKIVEIGNEGAGLLVRLLAYCARHLTDGDLPESIPHAYALGDVSLVERLTDMGLLVKTKAGWHLPSYLNHNPTKAEREEVLAKNRKYVADHRNRQAEENASNGHKPDETVEIDDVVF
jgi:hypothetical protein